MYVFVYGTLTEPERADTVLGDDRYEFDGTATLEGLQRVEGQYPTLAPGGGVDGRLLVVDEAGLERLDRYEGVDDGLYVRVSVPVVDRDESGHVYVGRPDRLGVASPVEWPDAEPFRDRVRRGLERSNAVVRPHE
ncbi:gamma-glutamylcyclotransferase family protein [Natrarchaeobius chitinivorans]|uniref:Gamma-glutamylcyclotransferase n=1 Tax=Natrarchaeobius chitinivorans TaxID=1679083 RepID=A0A3N6MKQ7_NATCH|nr:gamma-glutamylcyclotransferase family protein [Natrarchaeobius chitinivorans]RQG96551.1 gamma-glutamylcyclotransferase [Natrarchaeobius chitinivorans]